MNIIKIRPQGLCIGVAKAINIINKTINNPHLPRPIYMLGNVVHNKNIVNAFIKKGVIVLEGSSRSEMLKQATTGTIIFTAHGVSDELRKHAQDKGLHIVDATCRDVEKTHQLILNKLKDDYQVYFYGVKNHPETEGILGLSSKIVLITDEDDPNSIPRTVNPKAVLTTQTTMSYLDANHLYLKMKTLLPQLELVEEVCNATRTRQTAIMEYRDQIDVLLVVGDPSSNNTNKLKEVSEKKAHLPTFFLENVNDLNEYDFTKFERIGITAGASTPDAIVAEIIEALKNPTPTYQTKLKDDDFIK